MSNEEPIDWAGRISEAISHSFAAVDKARDEDLRAALAQWEDIPELAATATIVKAPGDDQKIDRDASGEYHIVQPKTIVLTDTRHWGDHPRSQDTPIQNRFQRVYEGSQFNVALLETEESAKISSDWLGTRGTAEEDASAILLAQARCVIESTRYFHGTGDQAALSDQDIIDTALRYLCTEGGQGMGRHIYEASTKTGPYLD